LSALTYMDNIVNPEMMMIWEFASPHADVPDD